MTSDLVERCDFYNGWALRDSNPHQIPDPLTCTFANLVGYNFVSEGGLVP